VPRQLCYIVRLLDVRAALDTLADKQRRAAALAQLSAGGAALVPALNHAAALVAKLRDASGYRWADLGCLSSRMRAAKHSRGVRAGAAAAAGAATAAAAGR
jgi:hypothetical protein